MRGAVSCEPHNVRSCPAASLPCHCLLVSEDSSANLNWYSGKPLQARGEPHDVFLRTATLRDVRPASLPAALVPHVGRKQAEAKAELGRGRDGPGLEAEGAAGRYSGSGRRVRRNTGGS